MSLFDRLFRRGRGGADPRRDTTTDAATPLYTTAPVHTGAGARDADEGDGRGDRDPKDSGQQEPGGREGEIEPSVQEIQVGEEGSSQQVDVGDSGSDFGGGGDPGGGGGDGGGGGGGE